MTTRLLAFLMLALPMAAARPALADDPPGQDQLPKPAPRGADKVAPSKFPPFFGIFGSADLIAKVGFRGQPGSYIEYSPDQKSARETGDSKGLRIAQVGPSVPGQRWIEVTGIGPGAQGIAMRILTKGEGLGNVQRLIVQGPQLPPMEMPIDSLSGTMPATMPGGNAGASLLSDAKYLGTETVKIPMGTFKTEHWLVSSVPGHRLEVWTTKDQRVPFTGCIKMATDSGAILAQKVGTDATSEVSVPPSHEDQGN